MDLRIMIYLLVIFFVTTTAQEDWETHCNKCHCLWVSGRKTANCAGRNFDIIPNDLSDDIRDIDFSNNFFYSLDYKVFDNAHLINVHKLKLQNCTIEKISQGAFIGLGLVIELDLSMNNIAVLDKNVFRPAVRLRTLILSHNKLTVLEDELFYNLTYFQKILLDHNEIQTVSSKTFQNLPMLMHVSLAHNKIQRISFDVHEQLPKLTSITLGNNPWICDCRLDKIRRSVIINNLISGEDVICVGPQKLKGRSWMEESVIFACVPKVLEVGPNSIIQAATNNVTLTCKVTGTPVPDVDWMNGGIIIERDPRKDKQKYITSKNTIGDYTWNNLTIINLNYKDRGEYKCIGKNPGGESEKSVTLDIPPGALSGGTFVGTLSTNTYLVIGLAIGIIVVLLIVLIILFCFCRKNTHGFYSKRRPHPNTSEEYINMSGGQAEIKKGLITDVNPVTKPPRTTVSPSVISGGTEVSDAKRTLLDNESVFDCDEETRSLDFDQPLLRKAHVLLDAPPHHYPPDLLPFPPRAAQVSPAGSSASTVADTTRLPPHHGPQSPINSPIYDQLSVYRTLPYSRSHSPFVGPPIRVPRTGYVTIPRRPRMQSWSSEPPNAGDMIVEPLYDNLGARTTADGGTNSTLSLNKLESNTSTPRSNRVLALSPTNCDPIAETHESPPSQVLVSQTLPRNLNATKLTPSKLQWTKDNAEALRSPEKRNSSSSLPPDGQPMKKIPPRPPPKPKKRISTGPLFEDEGEDGTEV
ncbi:leucine-rich repeat-containing protein 24 [Diorhabda sublineata]|uniref:leucine-rich repeat-containing protein 24 n=1 Tax=Diorhabda sublineata TaxID=1163346 RepID=UPI0024E08A4A|nr:leucine-rich repeat-containing protein 24 [Diorhabda sublineata]XP_056639138.1 leucine-rich repeat-containing protein 24 [Diorhabda sublineata]XP_056639139.1 leucine-rich repeat-containing protein 24 [Diorhabda sublineata]XP_056639140.1 leucine-rich repeat-containing protein 24 [Diorhabda sublineata]